MSRKKSTKGQTRFSGRTMFEKVRTAKGRKAASTRWLQRQLNDPYVAEARIRGYRSRSAFKLLELDDLFDILKPGQRVIDLGAAPGGWTQVIVEKVKPPINDSANSIKSSQNKACVIALDSSEMDPVPGATILHQDFLAPEAPEILKKTLGGQADIVLSDMAAPTTGHTPTDHIRIIALCEIALEFAEEVLAPDGIFIAKVLHGGTEHQLLARMKRLFRTVKHAKPPASRSDSAESYVVALGFRGNSDDSKKNKD